MYRRNFSLGIVISENVPIQATSSICIYRITFEVLNETVSILIAARIKLMAIRVIKCIDFSHRRPLGFQHKSVLFLLHSSQSGLYLRMACSEFLSRDVSAVDPVSTN